MQKAAAIKMSFEEADRADKEYYQRLTPHERLEILLELNRRWRMSHHAEAADRPARVYRIVKLP